MKKESTLYGVVGLLAGIVIAWTVAAVSVNNNYTGMMNMMGMHTGNTSQGGMMNDSDMSMAQMTDSLKGKTGDDFDEAFLAAMIAHHQGAVDMARLAQANAKHDEIKAMANDIISTQSQEIDKMQTWQSDWGYKAVPTMQHNMNMGR